LQPFKIPTIPHVCQEINCSIYLGNFAFHEKKTTKYQYNEKSPAAQVEL